MTDLQAAFEKIMGDVTMPDDSSPEYDEWLFNRAYEAGASHMAEENRRLREENAECEETIEALLGQLGTSQGRLSVILNPSDEVVERVAKSLFDFTNENPTRTWEKVKKVAQSDYAEKWVVNKYIRMAKAALSALQEGK